MSVHIQKIKYKSFTWIDVTHPDEATIAELAKKYKFHALDVEDVLSETQRSKIDDYDKYLFLVLHFPYWDSRSHSIQVAELNVFLSTNFLITLHHGELKVLKKFVKEYSEKLKLRRETMSKGMGFLLYEILDDVFEEHFSMIDQMEKRMDKLEKNVFTLRKGQQDMLRDILSLKKDLITFERTVGPLRNVIPQLEYKNDKFIPEGLEIYFDDIVDKVEKIWATLNNQNEVINLLQDTNEAVISHTTNNVIKILTIFSVIMLPITFVTGFFGMNVVFPIDIGAHDFAYIWISLGMLTIIVLMLLFFKLKKWI